MNQPNLLTAISGFQTCWRHKSTSHEQQILQRITSDKPEQFKSPRNSILTVLEKSRTAVRAVVIVFGIVAIYSAVNPGFVHHYVISIRNGFRKKNEMIRFVNELDQEEEKFNQLIASKYNQKLEKQYVKVSQEQVLNGQFFNQSG
jgi:hypothetical protein